MKLRTAILGTAALVLLLLVPAAYGTARPQTTEPDEYVDVNVTITDKKITLSEREFERGVGVNFIVRNTGKKVHNFVLLGESPVIVSLDREGFETPLLKPGQKAILNIFMDIRGNITYRSTVKADRSKAGMHGKFAIV